ncbi:hypothetical protein [Nitrosomonas communis]|uniref:hypothetical protein n=1 Tax=Nitrosomonas communis TaxID=44574 RepID=UPI0011600C00|nr:hypothetical protein [Nitrosomonas communis]
MAQTVVLPISDDFPFSWRSNRFPYIRLLLNGETERLFFLGNSVRTPMQWSDEANASFSTCSYEKFTALLFLREDSVIEK